MGRAGKRTIILWGAGLALAAASSAQPHAIDAGKSVMTVRAYKAGLLSALGHDHEISAPIARGTVDTTAHVVKLDAKASALQVRDPGVSEKDRAEIQTTMLGSGRRQVSRDCLRIDGRGVDRKRLMESARQLDLARADARRGRGCPGRRWALRRNVAPQAN